MEYPFVYSLGCTVHNLSKGHTGIGQVFTFAEVRRLVVGA